MMDDGSKIGEAMLHKHILQCLHVCRADGSKKDIDRALCGKSWKGIVIYNDKYATRWAQIEGKFTGGGMCVLLRQADEYKRSDHSYKHGLIRRANNEA